MLVSLPYSFSPGNLIYSAQVNANFTAVANAVNSIDNTNIGASGIYASQIIPTTALQAVFGGTQTYKFPSALEATVASMASYVPPVYTTTGAAVASTLHIVTGTGMTALNGTQVITLSGAAAFTGFPISYIVLLTMEGGSTGSITLAAAQQSGTQFTVTASNATGIGVVVPFNFIAIGV